MSTPENADNRQDDDDASMDHVNRLAIPQAEVTARMMEAFPTCDLDSSIPPTTFLVRTGLNKNDARALQLLFKRR
jgi:hypothetical protein